MQKIKTLITKSFNRVMIKFYSGGVIGYFAGSLGGGKEVGEPGRIPSFIFNIDEWQFHFHHWFISFLILLLTSIFLIKKKKLNTFIYSWKFGFLIGLIIHGIFSYCDWYMILSRN